MPTTGPAAAARNRRSCASSSSSPTVAVIITLPKAPPPAVNPPSRAAKRMLSALGQQLGERADDAIGLDGGFPRQAFAVSIQPDGVDAKPLWRLDLPFQIV